VKQTFLAMIFLAVGTIARPVLGDEPATKKPEPATKKPEPATKKPEHTPAMQTYFGVGIEATPPVLLSQLPTILGKDRGVLVTQVAKDSPAEKAGLHANDILVSIADHKLNSPEDLVRMVQADKPGQQVAVEYVRAGKMENCKVVLGEHKMPDSSEHPLIFRVSPDSGLRKAFEELKSQDGDKVWESFDALKLTRMDNNRWRAEIEFRNKEGKKEHKSFEGTREEIRKGIQNEKDLPANEQRHLLRALNLHEPTFEFHFPSFPAGHEF
jgi:membrane-associated protease RseP (regulator of RpoE activity)